MTFMLPSGIFTRHQAIPLLLVGVGGTGSHVLGHLAHLHEALTQLGHPGLAVTAYDGDEVSEPNLTRQKFQPADVGRSKAVALVERINQAFGTHWNAFAAPLEMQSRDVLDFTLVVSCVDTTRARRALHEMSLKGKWRLWMDFGNGKDFGQVILGMPDNKENRAQKNRLRTATEIHPELLEEPEEEELPSCSTMEALKKQDLYINALLAVTGMNILWQLLVHSQLEFHGEYVNIRTGHTRPLLVPEASNPKA